MYPVQAPHCSTQPSNHLAPPAQICLPNCSGNPTTNFPAIPAFGTHWLKREAEDQHLRENDKRIRLADNRQNIPQNNVANPYPSYRQHIKPDPEPVVVRHYSKSHPDGHRNANGTRWELDEATPCTLCIHAGVVCWRPVMPPPSVFKHRCLRCSSAGDMCNLGEAEMKESVNKRKWEEVIASRSGEPPGCPPTQNSTPPGHRQDFGPASDPSRNHAYVPRASMPTPLRISQNGNWAGNRDEVRPSHSQEYVPLRRPPHSREVVRDVDSPPNREIPVSKHAQLTEPMHAREQPPISQTGTRTDTVPRLPPVYTGVTPVSEKLNYAYHYGGLPASQQRNTRESMNERPVYSVSTGSSCASSSATNAVNNRDSDKGKKPIIIDNRTDISSSKDPSTREQISNISSDIERMTKVIEANSAALIVLAGEIGRVMDKMLQINDRLVAIERREVAVKDEPREE